MHPAQPQLTANTTWLTRLHEIIQTQLHEEDTRVDTLLTHFAVSRTLFYKKLKQLTGATPAQMLQRARLQRACKLLAENEQETVARVAQAVGMSNVINFTALFKNTTKLPPPN